MRRSFTEVATEIREAIDQGSYRRFERLPASRILANELGVARNTLRDALFQLEKEGLVETRAGSGTYVTGGQDQAIPEALEDATPLELIDARFALEPHICRLCVLNAKREDFDRLTQLSLQMEKSERNPGDFASADTEFHRALASATRNNLLIWLIGQINTVRSLDEWTRMRQLTLDEAIIQEYNGHHKKILAAIRDREPERAAQAMKTHLEAARRSLMRAAEA